jgi:hypothetical protein
MRVQSLNSIGWSHLNRKEFRHDRQHPIDGVPSDQGTLSIDVTEAGWTTCGKHPGAKTTPRCEHKQPCQVALAELLARRSTKS